MSYYKFTYQTESNKFYYLLEKKNYNQEDGVLLNPYKINQLDNVVIIKKEEVEKELCYQIKNTPFGVYVEIFNLKDDEKYIVNKKMNLSEALHLIEKIDQFSFDSAVKYIKHKFGILNQYFIYSN